MADKRVIFFRNRSGREPVKMWLKSLTKEERLAIGEDLRTLQRGWPVGMPLARKLQSMLWEVRSHLPTHAIARIIFTDHKDALVLLHGFIKKTQKTPAHDLRLAADRLRDMKEREHAD